MSVLAAAAGLVFGSSPVIASDFKYITYADDGTSYFGKVVAREGSTVVVRMKEVSLKGEKDVWNVAFDCDTSTIDGDPVEPETVGVDWMQFACGSVGGGL